MDIFYLSAIADGQATLAPYEAHHATKVMRHKVGHQVAGVDGLGNYVEGEIISATDHAVVLRISHEVSNWGEPPVATTLVLAPTKQRERTEWVLEKAVELGVTHIVPVLTARTERQHYNPDRYQRILIAAMKQCQRSRLPQLAPLTHYHEALPALTGQLGFIAVVGAQQHIGHYAQAMQKKPCVFLVGPEGDFTPAEVAHATDAGYHAVHLGTQRLRTETAALHLLSMNKLVKAF